MTIQGTNYGKVKTDNPVQISFNGGLGSQDCFVKTIEASKITCRIDTKPNPKQKDAAEATVVVFQKTSEEASCVKPNCVFTYTSTLPEVKTMEAKFDATASEYQLTISGTGFTGTTSNVQFEVSGVA